MDGINNFRVEGSEETVQSAGEICVLLVDNDETSLVNISQKLRKHGYRVVATTKAEDLPQIINSKNEKIDLVIAEYGLIEMHNYELLKKIKSDWEIPIVVAGEEYVEKDDITKCLIRGAKFFLKKPLMESFLECLWQFTIIDDVRHGSKRKERADSDRCGSNSGDGKNPKLICMEEETKPVPGFAPYVGYVFDERDFLPLRSVKEPTGHCAVPLSPQESSNKDAIALRQMQKRKEKKAQRALDEELKEDGISLFDLGFDLEEGQGSNNSKAF